MSKGISVLDLFKKLFHNFNARQMKDATIAFKKHLDLGGKMLLAMAGAMSSAQLGVTLAPMIRQKKIHIISTTGANLEESIFRLVAHESYKDYPDYRYFTKEDDQKILERGERRVTDTSIPEEEAFRVVEPIILKRWKEAEKSGKRFFPHEYFYQILNSGEFKDKYEGDPEHCWLLEAAKQNLPMVVPGWEDSTLGNIFAGYVKAGEVSANVMKTGVEYMVYLYEQYQELAKAGPGLGFFQIGGGIAGDFPICGVPSIKYDLKKHLIKLNEQDLTRMKQVSEYEWFKDNKEWQRQFKMMKDNDAKVEIQSLSSKGISFISETYLPQKIKEKNFLD